MHLWCPWGCVTLIPLIGLAVQNPTNFLFASGLYSCDWLTHQLRSSMWLKRSPSMTPWRMVAMSISWPYLSCWGSMYFDQLSWGVIAFIAFSIEWRSYRVGGLHMALLYYHSLSLSCIQLQTNSKHLLHCHGSGFWVKKAGGVQKSKLWPLTQRQVLLRKRIELE